ncbi:hypothetical protein Droror1_Dr00000128 [Drosera rotundifolia]
MLDFERPLMELQKKIKNVRKMVNETGLDFADQIALLESKYQQVILVATTNAKDLRNLLPSLMDHNACRVIGNLIAERAMEVDVFAMAFEPRRDERIEGKLVIVLDTIKENGVIFV